MYGLNSMTVGIRKSALAVKEKKSTEEPSTGERSIYLWLSLIALSPATPERISLQIASNLACNFA